MAESPLVKDMEYISYLINIDGNKLKDEYGVLSIDIERAINKISRASVTILLENGVGENEAFAPSEAEDFIPGSKVEIKLGYNAKEETVFKGIILAQSIRSRSGQRSTLTFKCQDEAVKLCLGKRTKSFSKQTDSAIIGSIIGEAGLSKDVENTTYKHPQLIQRQEVNWDFIIQRAEANGMIVYAEDGKVMVKKPLASGSADLKVSYDEDVYDFDGEIDASLQLPAVTHEGWDFKTQAFLSGDSAEPGINQQGNITGKKLAEVLGIGDYKLSDSTPLSTDELKGIANATLLRSRLAALRGRVVFIGNSKPKLNSLIEIEGFGERFNGEALITSIKHSVYEGNWRTEVGFGLPPEFYHEKPYQTSRGFYPSIQGLQNGLVTKIDKDPDGEHRIEVDVPVAGDKIWARLSNFYSTVGKGVFFMPEVGDEVVLGFIGNDPRFAVILGSLYSSKNTPPYTADAENSIKAFVTKADLKIELNDKDKVLTVETPAKNTFILSDKDKSVTVKDQNGNQIEMTSSGIVIKSAKDITLDASGKIELKADQNINVSSSEGDVSLNGRNVNANGQLGATVKGGASAELSAGGETTVKGAMVMIN